MIKETKEEKLQRIRDTLRGRHYANLVIRKNAEDIVIEVDDFSELLEVAKQQAYKEVKEYEGWVKAAQCPECDGSGAYYEGNEETPEVVQCQWCDYKRQFLSFLNSLEDKEKKEI